MDAAHQHPPVYPLPGLDDRPFALGQTQGDVLLQHVLLMAVEFQSVAHCRLGGGVPLVLGEHPGDLAQRGDGEVHRRSRHRRLLGHRRPPDLYPLVEGAAPFQRATKIDVGRDEARIERDRAAQGLDGGDEVAFLGLQARAVEQGDVGLGMFAVEAQPGAIDLSGGLHLAGVDQTGGCADEFAERAIARRDLL